MTFDRQKLKHFLSFVKEETRSSSRKKRGGGVRVLEEGDQAQNRPWREWKSQLRREI